VIPLVDLSVQHRQVAAEVAAGWAEVAGKTSFVGGAEVSAFEVEYAAEVGVGHCVGVGNGTDALELALRAVGVGPGAEVVLPALTFIATAEAVVRAGARPVLADVDPDHLLLDPADLPVTRRTAAVLPVHLYGQCAPVEALPGDVPVVEDAAQAQGARRYGRPAGGLGLAAATSFYPGKNLGAYGDAGAVLAADGELARRVRRLANHGSESRYRHTEVGMNSRLDTVQAVVLRAKLRRLAGWNAERRAAAARYDALLAGVPGVRRPETAPGNEHVWHLYVVRVERRDDVLAALHAAGVGAGVHYPVPVHRQPAFADLGYRAGAFPAAEAAAGSVLSLPLYPGISAGQQERVAAALAAAVS
jgi:dTDP-4-amino-4,6-dideoxygalactose transaminase